MATAKRQGNGRGTPKRPKKAAKRSTPSPRPKRAATAAPAAKAARTAVAAKAAKRAAAAKPARIAGAAKAAGTRAHRVVARRQPETLRLRLFSPGLTVDDLEKSIAFYTGALGFTTGERWERDGKLQFVMLQAGVCELGLGQDDWAKGRDRKKGEGVRLWCETKQDVDLLAARARAFGARLTEEPEDKPWGVRAFSLDDPDGYHLTFARPIAK